MNNLRNCIIRCKNITNYTECKRYAGHSKWSNIKHTKMAKDREKADALRDYVKRVKLAIADGKSAKIEHNPGLAKVIEQAKRQSLPLAALKNVITAAQNAKVSSQTAIFETKGPSGCLVIIQVLTDNLPFLRCNLNTHLRKSFFSTSEISHNSIFEHKGIVIAENKNYNLDKVTNDAIEIDALDVEPFKEGDKEYLEFSCYPADLYRIQNKLENLNYNIVQADYEFVPISRVTLTDEEMEVVDKLYQRLNTMEEVVKIRNNIA